MTTSPIEAAVFPFDHDHGTPPRDLVDLLGGKGAGLAEMTSTLGLDVPPGFTIALPVFRRWRDEGWPDELDDVVDRRIAELGDRLGRRFGDPADPLLVSVRSGAAISMPGMLDTVLDLGLNDETVQGLAAVTGDPAFAWDSYRRFLRMFATIVMDVPVSALPIAREGRLASATDVAELQAAIEAAAGRAVPSDPHEQLRQAIAAVFRSWDSERARAYRQRDGIAEDAGTAVNVQAMVFGNRGERSGTGVVFTRDPATGEPGPYGDYLRMGQGEDVVDGSAHPVPIAELATIDPAVYASLTDVLGRLERHYRQVCDVEFTVEDGRLWLLQTRAGKLSAAAAVRTAVEFVDDPDIALTHEEALARVPEAVRARARADLGGAGAGAGAGTGAAAAAAVSAAPFAVGLGASPGVVTGRAVFSSEDALAATDDVVLVRSETSPRDVVGMSAAIGVLTTRGGLASHAAVVARGWGLPAVVGAASLTVHDDRLTGPDGVVVRAGERITIDGASGAVWLGEAPAGGADAAADSGSAFAWLDRLESWLP